MTPTVSPHPDAPCRGARGPSAGRAGLARVLARVLEVVPAALLAVALMVPPARAQSEPFAEPAALEWRAVFKLLSLTAHGEPGDAGFVREGDDTRESNQQSVRLQLTGQPLFWLDYRFDYLNVKQNLAEFAPGEASGAALFRYRPWRRAIEEPRSAPGQLPSTQTVQWYHEVDHAYVRVAGGAVEAVLGRQPITWGVGRIWQPTDVFATFSPLALDTEYKPGIDGVLLNAYPFDYASVSLAYILSPEDEPDAENSSALRWRGQVGEVSELTALLGSVRGDALAGGSFETAWLEAGWRIEGIAFRPEGSSETATFAIAGVDHQLSNGTLLLAELYDHSLGAASEPDLRSVLAGRPYREGRMLQLSHTVLAAAASRDFLGLWNASYTLFAAPLRDPAGARHTSTLHQLALRYSVSDDAEAVFALITANGRGLGQDGVPRSEFGHVPASLYVSVQFVL